MTGVTRAGVGVDVNTGEIVDNAVTLAKLEHGTQGDVLYYGAAGEPFRLGAGTSGDVLQSGGAGANPSWTAAGAPGAHALDSAAHSDVAIITEAQGQVIYYDGTNWNALDAGTSGQFLKTQGAGANPVWASTAAVAHAFDSATHTDVAAITEAQGQVLYYDGSNWNALGAGTDGQFLKTQGAAANPVWATVAGGEWEHIASSELGSAGTFTFSGIAAGYEFFLLYWHGVSARADDPTDYVNLRFNNDSGNNYNYEWIEAEGATLTSGSTGSVSAMARAGIQCQSDTIFSSGFALVGNEASKTKSVVMRGGRAGLMAMGTGYWNETVNEISTIYAYCGVATNFRTGSKCVLLGMKRP